MIYKGTRVGTIPMKICSGVAKMVEENGVT
jgi:hypothetical protein